jgi:hypothetical protein
MALFDTVRFGGMVLAHAAWIASDLEDGSLICPFAIIETAGERKVITFESDSQAESIERGKASFEEYRDKVGFWSFAREGLLSYVGGDQPKVDVLSVSAWKVGLEEPIILQQCFVPKATGVFKLIGPLTISIYGMIPPEPTQTKLQVIALEGIKQHPHGELWTTWMGT